jgi:tetratricopeptide (TPR) repeat protein
MMTIILYLIIFISLVSLGVIVYRKIPLLTRLSDEEMLILERKKGVIERIREIDYKRHWLNFVIFLEKFLRRVKIIFLKLENLLSKWVRGLRNHSQVMTQKSKEWIKQREIRRRQVKEKPVVETKKEIPVKIDKEKEDEEDISISDLEKPIKEEQKWINLIIENPKNITAYKFLGLLYWKQHNYSDAKASLEMAVRLGSKDKKVKEVLRELKRMKKE